MDSFIPWPTGEKVERISQEQGLSVGNGVHPGEVGHDLRLLLNASSTKKLA
jgi:hypothetical protein